MDATAAARGRPSPATSTCSRTTPTRQQLLQLPRELPDRQPRRVGGLADILIPFPDRQVICSAGKVLATPPAARCTGISPAPSTSGRACSSATTRSRPIINTRDEPHADAERFRAAARDRRGLQHEQRHAAQGRRDPTWCCGWWRRALSWQPAPGEPDRGYQGRQPPVLTPGRRRKVRLANGREAARWTSSVSTWPRPRTSPTRRAGADTITQRVLDLWEHTLHAVDTGNFGLVNREIDWITKFQLIERYGRARPAALPVRRVAQLDLAYHDVHRGRGLYFLLPSGAGRWPGPRGTSTSSRPSRSRRRDHPGPAAR